MRRVSRLGFILLLLFASPLQAVELDGPVAPEGPWVHLHADRLVREPTGEIVAEGGVRLSVGTLHVAADRAVYDPEAQTVVAEGRVTLVDGKTVARAQEVRFDLRLGTGVLDEVAFFQKAEPQDPEALLGAEDVAKLRAIGKNEVILHAEQVARLSDGGYFAVGPKATVCDCPGSPDWEVGARSVKLSESGRLNLSWPVFYAKGLPVFAAPYFSIPLTNERRSGLLAPSVSLLGRRGPAYEQPFYLVLGNSWDLTFSLGYYLGNSRDATDPQGRRVLGPDGEPLREEVAFRGPRATLELRWAPRLGSSGRGFVSYGYDESLVSSENLAAKRASSPGVGGYTPHRFGVQLDHADDWGGGLSDRIALNLVSDRNYIRDFTDDIVLRGEEALRSTAWVGQRLGAAFLVAEAVYFQDLRPAFPSRAEVPPDFSESVRLFGKGQRDTFARIPGVAFDLSRFSLPGGIGLSMHLGAARFAPLTERGFGDWGRDGLGPGDIGYPGRDADGSEADGIFQAGELPAAFRFSIRPTLSRSFVLGRVLSLSPYAGWREELYEYEQQSSGAAGWGVFGMEVRSEIARFYGRLRHAWTPTVEVRHLLFGHADRTPVSVYDELDARPTRSTTQARFALGTRVDVASEALFYLDARVGQDVRAWPDPDLAESFAEAGFHLGPFAGSGLFRVDTELGRLTEAVTRASLTAEAGHQLRASYRRMAQEGSDRIRAAPDALFGDPDFFFEVPAALLGSLEAIGAGATVLPFEGLTLSYDLLFLPTLERARLLEQRASIGYESACRCWAGTLHFAKRRNEALSAWVSLQLGAF